MMKKVTKCSVSIIMVTIIVILGIKGFNYLVTDDTKSFTRMMMHDFYNQDENIDILFVGSSHCYRSIIPSIMDERLECHSFNVGSSAQKMDGSLAIIKECINYYEPREIVLDIYYDMIDTIEHKDREELTSTYVISDYMKLSFNKVSYLLNASSSDKYINSFIIGRRYWRNILDINYVMDLWNKKSDERYKNYIWVKNSDDDGYYVDRGYVASDEKMNSEEVCTEKDNIHIDITTFTEEWKEELAEIINICKKNDIKLTAVAAPLPLITLEKIDNYKEYAQYIEDILCKYEVRYVDFNLDNNKIETLTDDCFMDKDHLNNKGAEIYSKKLAEILAEVN